MQLNALCSFHSSFRRVILQSRVLSVARFTCLRHLKTNISDKGICYSILDAGVAETVMKLVWENQINKSSTLIISNQGKNPHITNAALKVGFPDIILTEKNSDVLKGHLKIAQKFPACRVKGRVLNLFDWTFTNLLTEENLQQEMNTLGQFEQNPWSDDPPLTVFGIVTPGTVVGQNLFKYLTNQLVTFGSLYTKGSVDWFLFINPMNYQALVKGKLQHHFKTYRPQPIMVNILYDWKVLLKLPAVSFWPPLYDVKFKKEEVKYGSTVIRKNEIYLVQFTPKASLFQEHLLEVRDINACFMFLEQLLANKSRRLIPRIEQMVPGSGIELIKMGYTMVTLVADLKSPEEMVHLFKAIRNLPEFQASPLETLVLHGKEEYPQAEDGVLEGH
ncbi:hypothetical protein ACJMK2_037904 [Sinanodonta woodiana]|uniref:Dimethyladenosine transferase 2, mitochondrial n=1 Tax=Sinanodonta woodiana TaxID=1069815 RepID=A0ABD3WLV4_SINWO